LASPYKYIASLIKNIQKLLNSNGLCSSYTELGRFLTSVANRPITQGGHLIQEDSDNIDINAETVDGKNHFHSLARAVFQFKSVDELAVCAERIKLMTLPPRSPMLYPSSSQNLE
jgi:hypothetical protein